MAAQILIVPGSNVVLARIARHLQSNPQVAVLETANAALWQIRHAPPATLLADTSLPDIGGIDLAEIVALLNPNVRLILCGGGTPGLVRAVEAKGIRFIREGDAPDQTLRQVYQALGVAPPARPPTGSLLQASSMSSTAALQGASPSRPAPVPPVSPPQASASTARAPSSAGARPQGGAPEPWMPRGGSQVIQPHQMAAIQALLQVIAREVGALCILLSDTVGMRLLEVGPVPPAFGPAIEPLLATSFSTAAQLTHQLKEQEARTLYMHEGVRFDIYACNVGLRFILTLIFDKDVHAANLAAVLPAVRRATGQLQRALEQ